MELNSNFLQTYDEIYYEDDLYEYLNYKFTGNPIDYLIANDGEFEKNINNYVLLSIEYFHHDILRELYDYLVDNNIINLDIILLHTELSFNIYDNLDAIVIIYDCVKFNKVFDYYYYYDLLRFIITNRVFNYGQNSVIVLIEFLRQNEIINQ